MAATVQIQEKNGATPTATQKDGGTVRFKNADDATVDNNDPLVKPSSNREYSYEKWVIFNVTGGTYTNITNIEFYMDGTNNYATGIKLWGKNVTTYVTPAVPTETNDPPQIPVNGTPGAATDAFSWTSGSPLTLGAGPFTGTGEKGDHIVLVMEVETTASNGASGDETATWEWDEI